MDLDHPALGFEPQVLQLCAEYFGRSGLVTVLGAQTARGVLDDVQSLGDRARVGEVVQADVAHEAPCVGGGEQDGQTTIKARFGAPICT